jgi:hypothetical protein
LSSVNSSSVARAATAEATHLTETSTVIPPAQQQQISAGLEHDAEVMSNTQLQQQIAGEPPAGRPG